MQKKKEHHTHKLRILLSTKYHIMVTTILEAMQPMQGKVKKKKPKWPSACLTVTTFTLFSFLNKDQESSFLSLKKTQQSSSPPFLLPEKRTKHPLQSRSPFSF